MRVWERRWSSHSSGEARLLSVGGGGRVHVCLCPQAQLPLGLMLRAVGALGALGSERQHQFFFPKRPLAAHTCEQSLWCPRCTTCWGSETQM